MIRSLVTVATCGALVFFGCGPGPTNSGTGGGSGGGTGGSAATGGGAGGGSGGGSGTGGAAGTGGGGGTVTCTATLSGAFTGSFGCTVLAALNKAANLTSININNDSSSGGRRLSASLGVSGEAQATTYTPANSQSFVITYQDPSASGSVWHSGGSADAGSESMTLTHVSTQGDTSSLRVYSVHGTLDATLEPSGSADAGVNLHVAF